MYKDYYGAVIYKAPFNEQTVNDINNWVKQNTDEMIPEILDQIPAEAVMYLVNALAFEAEWERIYNEYDVRDGEFTLINGVTQNVEYMYGEEHIYLEDENTKICYSLFRSTFAKNIKLFRIIK